MYHTFFGLKEPAFSIAVNPHYLYMSRQHKEALAHLLYGVTGGGFVMLTGEVGTGKTTIIRCLLEQMPSNTDIAIVMNPMSNVPELLSIICDELGAAYNKNAAYGAASLSIKELTDALHQFLLRNHTQGRNTILLIDEAQLLSIEALEQIRLLTNLETKTQKLLHIILVGQPELKTLLAKPQLRQLSQRITARFHLAPLSLVETHAYIRHRLKMAGLADGRNPIPYSVVKPIHIFSGGIPRLINVICERCLIGAFAQSAQQVDNAIFTIARNEILGEVTPRTNLQFKHYGVAAGIFLVTALMLVSFLSGQHFTATTSNASAQKNPTIAPAKNNSTPSSIASLALQDVAIENYTQAEDNLLRYLNFSLNPNLRPCRSNSNSSNNNSPACEKVTLHNWAELVEINRPAIIVLSAAEKTPRYIVLVGINQENARVINAQQQSVNLALAKMSYAWTGEIFYLWQKPENVNLPLTLGNNSETVAWVAQQFALLDKQETPLADNVFTIALQERIKLFQRAQGLQPDGIIGQRTLMKINEVQSIDKTLLTDF
jgi:general secretion pathway protein A